MIHQFNEELLLPVAELETKEDGFWLAELLLENGIRALEVTNRTKFAFDIAADIKATYPELRVGMGTIVNQEDLDKAIALKLSFCVSPGLLSFLPVHADIYQMPFMPGIQTMSEAMKALDMGIHHVKVFPVNLIGGAKFIQYIGQVLPSLTCCPSGGVNIDNVGEYLSLSNVKQVASSQLADKQLIKARDKLTLTDMIAAFKSKLKQCETVSV